jgi:PAS domain S-box-containing protein
MEAAFRSRIILSPLESVAGILVTAAIRNISARKEVEKHLAEMEERPLLVEDSLRQSEASYRMLLDGIQNYAIFMMDPSGRIISWNGGAERIKGYRADEISGTTFPASFLRKISCAAGRRRYSERPSRAVGMKNKACACGKTVHDFWRMQPLQRCATRTGIRGDFLSSAMI